MSKTYRDFRQWLREEEELGELLRIKNRIKCGDPNSFVDCVPAGLREEHMRVINCPGANGKVMETELRALVRYLHTLPNKPIAIIENPINNMPNVPVIVNPWATRERALRFLGCKDKDDLAKKLRELKTNLMPPLVVAKNKAPVKEVVVPEEEVDLYQAPRNWVEFENVSWSPTGGAQWVVFDSETRTHDLGEWRCGFFEWDDGDPSRPFPEVRRKTHLFVALIYRGLVETDGGRFYRERYRKNNKPMPAAMVMCSDPAVIAAAISRLSLVWPEDRIDEYSAAGGWAGVPVEIVESETIPGLMVPAHAEWVFEGEFLPEDYVIPPYGEAIFTGYMFGGEACPVFRVKCITRRRNPLWCTTWSSSGFDHEGCHSQLVQPRAEAEAMNYLRQNGYRVKDVVRYENEILIIQSDIDGAEKPPNYGMTLLYAMLGCNEGYIGKCSKYLIAVGPDIDPYNLRDVVWAVGTRTRPVSDSIMIKEGLAAWGDPTARRGPLGWKTYGEQMLIDALIKVPEKYESFEPRSDPASWEREAIARITKKLHGLQ